MLMMEIVRDLLGLPEALYYFNPNGEYDIERAGHLNFTDFPLYSPLLARISPDVKQNNRIVNEASLCFLDRHLKGNLNSSFETISNKYPGIHLQKGN